MRVLFTGSGGGGHIFPLIAVARELTKISSQKGIPLELYYLGPEIEEEFSRNLIAETGISMYSLRTGKFRRYFSIKNFIDIFKIPVGIIQALYRVFAIMPDIVISKGAYGSVPVVFSGWLYRIPILIHDSDTVPGLANKIVAPLATRIALGFEKATHYFSPQKTIVTGNPVRPELQAGDATEGRRIFGIQSTRPVLLVMGGSQGAMKINDAVLNALPILLQKYEVLHIAGEKNYKTVASEARVMISRQYEQLYHPYPSLKGELAHAYALSSLIISRSGATSIFEIALVGKPSILIPIKVSGGNHQRENAYVYKAFGACEVIEEDNLTPHVFVSTIDEILESASRVKVFSENAKKFSAPRAAEILAELAVSLTRFNS